MRPVVAIPLAMAGTAVALAAAVEGAHLVGRPSPDWPERRWVQGGPLGLGVFSKDAPDPRARADYGALRAAILDLLEER